MQNLQGPQLSTKAFCKRLPAIDPFFCLGSEYTRSEDIAYVFDQAIKREQNYEQNKIATQCVSPNDFLISDFAPSHIENHLFLGCLLR